VKIIRQRVAGTMLVDGDRVALRLGEAKEPAAFLAYALTTQGIDAQILPGSLLDDWGTEIKNLTLYRWIRENGLHFPRAEVFGVDPQGNTVQYFVRDLELFARYPTYAAADQDAPQRTWRPLTAVLLPDPRVAAPEPAAVAAEARSPLREARLTWWRVPPDQEYLGFLGKDRSEPG